MERMAEKNKFSPLNAIKSSISPIPLQHPDPISKADSVSTIANPKPIYNDMFNDIFVVKKH
jgi:hypothetical protein